MTRAERLQNAYSKDPTVFVDRTSVGETLGENPDYLFDVLGLTKSDLIQLERKGLALKARYEVNHDKKRFISHQAKENNTPVSGTHRVRWIIFKEAINVAS